MTAEEWLNVLAILESIDEVPGMPSGYGTWEEIMATRLVRNAEFRANPIRFLRRADDATRAAIWAEVTRRLGGGS